MTSNFPSVRNIRISTNHERPFPRVSHDRAARVTYGRSCVREAFVMTLNDDNERTPIASKKYGKMIKLSGGNENNDKKWRMENRIHLTRTFGSGRADRCSLFVRDLDNCKLFSPRRASFEWTNRSAMMQQFSRAEEVPTTHQLTLIRFAST